MNEKLVMELQAQLAELKSAARELLETTPEERQNPSVWHPRVDRLRAAMGTALGSHRASDCRVRCQYAADVSMLPEHECAHVCQYAERSSEAPHPGLAPCPHCFESSGYAARHYPHTWDEPGWSEPDPTRPCHHCEGTGSVECAPVTLGDLEEMAAEESK